METGEVPFNSLPCEAGEEPSSHGTVNENRKNKIPDRIKVSLTERKDAEVQVNRALGSQ